MIAPPRWTPDELEAARARAVEDFRRERLEEPVEAYSQALTDYQSIIEDLLKATGDLCRLDDDLLKAILANKDSLEAFRYLSGPPISQDDLKTLAQAPSLAPSRIQSDVTLAPRIVRIVLDCLDHRRFPWVAEKRAPTQSERDAALLAWAVLMAYQRIQTSRRNEGKATQEARVAAALRSAGFREIERRAIHVVGDAPDDGEFCAESLFGSRKADFIVGLWDKRKMPVECKVSNSELNSVKRLNNDAAVKAEVWLGDFGPRNVVPTAMLSGVYKLASLTEAQDRGLALFWAHDLDAFLDWLERTKNA